MPVVPIEGDVHLIYRLQNTIGFVTTIHLNSWNLFALAPFGSVIKSDKQTMRRHLASQFVHMITFPKGQGQTRFTELWILVQRKIMVSLFSHNYGVDRQSDKRTVHQACDVWAIIAVKKGNTNEI